MRVNAIFPDGKKQPLIWIKDWDFAWQDQYFYKQPIKVPKGTRLTLEFTYDNSADNPRNPNDPPARVKWGEETKDEMALAFIQFVSNDPTAKAQMRRAMILDAIKSEVNGLGIGSGVIEKALQLVEKDGAGKSDAEMRAALKQAIRQVLQEK